MNPVEQAEYPQAPPASVRGSVLIKTKVHIVGDAQHGKTAGRETVCRAKFSYRYGTVCSADDPVKEILNFQLSVLNN